jgi:hypothetical protein
MKRTILAVCLGVAPVGCGGDDDMDCSEFSACGGDPVGEWTIADACFAGSQGAVEGCPESSTRIDDFVLSGTIDLRADGSYASDISTMGTAVLTVPMSCLNGATCDDLAQASGLPCSANGDACECENQGDARTQETGTWEASGSTITTMDSGGDTGSNQYCVDGDVLELHDVNDVGTITVVLTR